LLAACNGNASHHSTASFQSYTSGNDAGEMDPTTWYSTHDQSQETRVATSIDTPCTVSDGMPIGNFSADDDQERGEYVWSRGSALGQSCYESISSSSSESKCFMSTPFPTSPYTPMQNGIDNCSNAVTQDSSLQSAYTHHGSTPTENTPRQLESYDERFIQIQVEGSRVYLSI
jgi:hypothetical protein